MRCWFSSYDPMLLQNVEQKFQFLKNVDFPVMMFGKIHTILNGTLLCKHYPQVQLLPKFVVKCQPGTCLNL